MYDDLTAYFHENVLTSYKEFIDSLNDGNSGISKHLRAAINAATVLYHLREHLPDSHQKSRQQVADICPDYNLVADIANVSKHKHLSRGNPQIDKAEDIQEECILTRYKDEHGEYFGSERTVLANLSDGSNRHVGEILTNVMNYWCNEFHLLNIISHSIQFSYESTIHPLTREQVDVQENTINAIQGVRSTKRYKLQEYNYETGSVTPMDLSGCEMKMNIYKPAHMLNITLKKDHTDETISKDIELNNEQYEKYESLCCNEKKQEYLFNLANEQGIFQELTNKAREIDNQLNQKLTVSKASLLSRLAFWRYFSKK